MKRKDMTAIFDLDRVAYKSAAAGQKDTVFVSHKGEQIQKIFKNRTEFWGSKRSRDQGWLGEFNEERGEPLSWEDFEIKDIHTPSPLRNVLYTAKRMVEKDLEAAGTKKAKFFIGVEDGYRLDKSTLQEYKGNRKDLVKPVLLQEVKDYLIKTYKPTLVRYIETDDAVTEAAYKRNDRFVLSNDKDSYAQPTLVFNPDSPNEGIVDCRGLGKLWVESKPNGKKYRGTGRKFLYWQMLAGDTADNYKASKFSSKSFGEGAAYACLVECAGDKECLQAVVDSFKYMYPEESKVVGWRGDEVVIDWLYVMNEMLQMARMRRFEGDEVTAAQLLTKVGIKV